MKLLWLSFERSVEWGPLVVQSEFVKATHFPWCVLWLSISLTIFEELMISTAQQFLGKWNCHMWFHKSLVTFGRYSLPKQQLEVINYVEYHGALISLTLNWTIFINAVITWLLALFSTMVLKWGMEWNVSLLFISLECSTWTELGKLQTQWWRRWQLEYSQ